MDRSDSERQRGFGDKPMDRQTFATLDSENRLKNIAHERQWQCREYQAIVIHSNE